jgi:nitrogen fixation NifU-like protein
MLDAEGRVSNIKFEGQGCAISQATVSMLTDHVKGMTLSDAAKLGKDDVFALLGFPVGMTRLRCALLGLKTLQTGIATRSDISVPTSDVAKSTDKE